MIGIFHPDTGIQCEEESRPFGIQFLPKGIKIIRRFSAGDRKAVDPVHAKRVIPVPVR